MSVSLTLVVAYSANRVIGLDNRLPWRLPGDLAHFKRTTLGSPIIMGRKTWDSLGRPLPGRLNIVLSRDPTAVAPGATVTTSLEEALAACGDATVAYVIGGAQIYAMALPHAQTVIATEIEGDVPGDAYFPALPAAQWRERAREIQPEENGHRYAFVYYERTATAQA